jgi:hypothetical protein
MVIKIEKGEEGIGGIVAVRFSSREEYDEWLQESRRRLKKKANQMHITDIDKAQRKYGSKIMDKILEEYLEQHNPKIAIEVDQL